MRVLECGCEILQDTGQFISLCVSHGQHVQSRLEAGKHPRAQLPTIDKVYERELVKIMAPVVYSKMQVPDHETFAEKLYNTVTAITRRFE